MVILLLYYIIVPLLAAFAAIRLIRRYGASAPAEDIQRLCLQAPIEKKFFRAARRDHKGLESLGDFETQPDAVDRIYLGRKETRKLGESASFLVLNDKSEVLQQVDS